MSWYQYWHETNLLIVSSGSSNLFIFKLGPKCTYDIKPTLNINLPQTRSSRGIEPLPVQITRLIIHTFIIYGHQYIGFLNIFFVVPTLSLYCISTKQYQKEFELDLKVGGTFSFNLIDNLLLAHNMTEKTTLVFDIKSPLPSQSLTQPNHGLFDLLGKSAESVKEVVETGTTNEWFSFPSNYIVAPLIGRIFTVQINLATVMDEMESNDCFDYFKLTEFIIRRELITAFPLRLVALRKALYDRKDVCIIRPIYDLLCMNFESYKTTTIQRSVSLETAASELSYRFSASMSVSNSLSKDDISIDQTQSNALSFQDDIFCHLFTPLIPVFFVN
jgi:hypothetical protein